MALRYDIGTLRSPTKYADGRIRVDGYLTRTGVFEYRNADGSLRREYRPPEEVFKADSLASFQLVPLTDNHPPEMVTAQNAKQFAIGAVGETVRQDGDKVAATIIVYDAATISKLERGKVQLSCGYEADVEDSPGEIDGQRYDAIQRNIRGNHVALVDVGRAGPDVRVRMDAGIMVPEPRTDFIIEDRMDEKLTEALAKVAELQVECASQKARADKAESDRDTAQAGADAKQKELDAAVKARTDSESTFLDRVRARVALETKAASVLGADAKVETLSDRDIKIAVVKKVDGEDLPAEKSEAYVDGRYDASISRFAKTDAALANAREAAQEATSAPADTEADARKKMIERNRNAWKGAK